MYHDNAANRHYLVRYDVTKGGRDGITVLANRLDTFLLTYYDVDGNPVDVTSSIANMTKVWKIMIDVGVTLPAQGTFGSPGYHPERPLNLRSEVVLRNASQITY
jgi:hypothetical protein